jgi:acetyl esterase
VSQQVSKIHEAAAIDPGLQVFVDAIARDYSRYRISDEPTLEQARATAEKVREPWARGGPHMARVSDWQVPFEARTVRVRLFEPELQQQPTPVLVYLHGGGWTLFSLDTHDRLMREYAARTGFKVLGVDYSLAPEFPFPTQLDEIAAVLDWLPANSPGLGIDPARIAMGGDSAGANLTIASCIRARDSGKVDPLQAMLLNYGAYDPSGQYSAAWSGADSHLPLTVAEMAGFWNNYLPRAFDHLNPLANPLQADLRGLPPALLVVAECDILRDENLQMEQQLQQAGVAASAVVYPGASHSFLEAMSVSALSDRALAESCAWLQAQLA